MHNPSKGPFITLNPKPYYLSLQEIDIDCRDDFLQQQYPHCRVPGLAQGLHVLFVVGSLFGVGLFCWYRVLLCLNEGSYGLIHTGCTRFCIRLLCKCPGLPNVFGVIEGHCKGSTRLQALRFECWLLKPSFQCNLLLHVNRLYFSERESNGFRRLR